MPRALIVLVAIVILVSLRSVPTRAEDKPASQAAKIEPVDFHKLQEFMPEKAVGVDRSDLGGENVSAGEIAMSNATADYTKPDSDGSDAYANIQISDYGAAPQMVAGMTAWRMVPVNVSNDEGYQRTAKLKDYPAFETYTKEGESRQMIVLVAERFLVTIDTTHVSEADFKKFVDGLPWEKLAKLK